MTRPDHHEGQISEREYLNQMITHMAIMTEHEEASFEHPSIPIALKASVEGRCRCLSSKLSACFMHSL